MILIDKRCDCCSQPLAAEEFFDHVTITEGGTYTTWEICGTCAKELFERFEREFAYTRNRRSQVKEEVDATSKA